jgi:transcriptional regulator with XRE-family HTH domain
MQTKILDIDFYRNASEQQPTPYPTHDIDRHIGGRLRQQRVLNGLTEGAMADLIGVTRKQARKYENGVNRITAGRLYAIAQALGVDVGYFFEGLQSAPPREHTSREWVFLDFARDFRSIRKRKHQEVICFLARVLAEVEKGWDTVASDLDEVSEMRS